MTRQEVLAFWTRLDVERTELGAPSEVVEAFSQTMRDFLFVLGMEWNPATGDYCFPGYPDVVEQAHEELWKQPAPPAETKTCCGRCKS